ncbi:MAG: winged helix-turn-helix domain-containing protein [Bacteroides sp.]|nr:winged helix-turn-helix domain-containing protein [Bacteroides sp.]
MNTDTIGQNAGSVWAALNEAEALGIKQLKKNAKIKTEKELFAALGWLAREGKVNFQESEDGKDMIISLVQG